MSFRRKGKAIHEQRRAWEQWLCKHEHAIRMSGLPETVLQDEEHWCDFLEHGYLDHREDPRGWNQLSEEQRRELRRFLDATLSPDEKASAIVLRRLETDT